jgi:DNA-binding LacI/PurR family transcriptional regulator
MNPTRPVTLKEIAQRAGVGTTAASVVLNGAKSGTRVSEQTREAILRAARELNYRPNELARSLRKRQTGLVGYFSGYRSLEPRNPYVAEVLGGLQNACTRNGLDLLLYTPHAGHTPTEIVANLANGRLDGLVVTGLADHPVVSLLQETHLPVVAISDPIPHLPTVRADDAEGGRLQARHLAERGHRRVLYRPAGFPYPSALERLATFREEAAGRGIEVVMGAPLPPEIDHSTPEGRATMALRDSDLAQLRGSSRCTAIQCWEDAAAYVTASQLASLGLDVPGDVAVAGYNGFIPDPEPRWHLTTVRAPWRRVAEVALDTLHTCIQGQLAPSLTVLPVEFVRGATT